MATFRPLTFPERAASGFTHKVTISNADIIGLTSATAYSINPTSAGALQATGSGTFPIGTVIKTVICRFAAAATLDAGTQVMIMGDSGDTARYLASVTTATKAWLVPTYAKQPYVQNTAVSIDIVITSAGGGTVAGTTTFSFEAYLDMYELIPNFSAA